MTVSIKRMSAGDGYRYLMQTVAVGDGNRPAPMSMTRYYVETGTPAGRWLGAGLDGVRLDPGSLVTEEQLFQLIGMGGDPATGDPLGTAPQPAAPVYRDRVDARLSQLPAGLSDLERAERVGRIREEERLRVPTATARKAVTGFDFTFSVPKSVSAVWALADADTQRLIVEAHHAAVGDALAWAERNVFATRLGKGGVVRRPVRGVIAAAFDHYDSRANDPHLHTHVVVANRVQTEAGGKWRTLDSRGLFRATVALSELHQGLLMDRISTILGLSWDGRARRHSPVLQWEITGVSDQLRAEFSQRATAIDAAKDRLVADYRAAHGRPPDAATVLKLRQHATLTTRPDKHSHALADLCAAWQSRARRHVGADPTAWTRNLPRTAPAGIRSVDVTAEQVHHIAEATLTAVADKRATFTRWNLYAEAQRQLQRVRFDTATDRAAYGDRVTDSALGLAMLLTAPDPAPLPLKHVGAERYTTGQIFDAESRLLAAGRTTSGPSLPDDAVTTMAALSPEQQAVVAQIATSGREVDLLVGAAGTGKTATMAGLAAAWQTRHGPGSVVGLAPSAAAADVLATELQLATENTAKWTVEAGRDTKRAARIDALRRVLDQLPTGSAQAQRVAAALHEVHTERQRWRLHPGQLVIVDEASLAGTLTLDRIVAQARSAQAKVLLVGDWAQLSAIDAGGAFTMLVRDRGEAPELLDVRRFTQTWEKQASLALRAGLQHAIDTYAQHGRIHEGDRGDILDAAYTAWLTDRAAGKRTLLIAPDAATVTDLNLRAHNDLAALGHVSNVGVRLADGTTAGIGDHIVTRRNDRTLISPTGWVKNGDQWTVIDERNGALTVQQDGTPPVTLPADYTREHVELGYATTAHRAQGQTVDTAHTVITGPGLNREALYVAATRGRETNHLYVTVENNIDVESSHGPGEYPTARDVLVSVLTNRTTNVSAHETVERDAAPNGSTQSVSPTTRPSVPARPTHEHFLSSPATGVGI